MVLLVNLIYPSTFHGRHVCRHFSRVTMDIVFSCSFRERSEFRNRVGVKPFLLRSVPTVRLKDETKRYSQPINRYMLLVSSSTEEVPTDCVDSPGKTKSG